MAVAANKIPMAVSIGARQQRPQGVPSCARPCLDYFKNTGYSCDADDLSCLCSRYSSQGLTLGELAYGCSHFECESTTEAENRALYNICSGQEDVVSATHSTVTLPAYSTTFSAQETPASSARSSSPIPATATPSGIESTIGIGQTSSSSQSHTPATGLPPLPDEGSSDRSTNLTTAQAVGISIAAMGALCIAGALIWLLLWCKRRRAFKSPKARNGSFDFIDKGSPRHSPFRHGYADPRGPLGGFAKPRVELDNSASPWYAQQAPSRVNHGVQPQSHGSISPESRSHDSLRTVSQLLPEKAGHTPPQPQYRSPRAASVFSTATIFEEDGKTPKLLSPATMLPMPMAPKPVLKTVPRRPERPERPVYSAVFVTSPVDVRNPESVSNSPSKSLKKELTPSPLRNIPPPPPVPEKPHKTGRTLSTDFRVSTHRSLMPSSSIPSYMPEYYTSDDSRSPTFDMIPSPHRKPVPISRSTKPPSTKAYRCSGGSDTSFESTDPDEITPPDEVERHLSPVPEGDSPNRNIKYPKVPRSSNQAVPRSPQPTLSPSYRHSKVWPLKDEIQTPAQLRTPAPKTPPHHGHQPSLSGSTLAAKRLGSSAATSLSNGLHIKSSSNPQNSPLKGYGRPANSNSLRGARGGRPPLSQRKPSYAGTGYGPDPDFEPRTPEMMSPGPKILRTEREVVLRSPLWEPKLTPSRRGEDLFLSVSLASPGVAPGGGGVVGGVDGGRAVDEMGWR